MPFASPPRGRKTESKGRFFNPAVGPSSNNFQTRFRLEEQIDVYDQLLRRLRFKVDVHDQEVIDRVLNQVGISLQSSYVIIPWLILSIVQPFLISGHARYLRAGKTDGQRAGGQY
jgi:hypothetical protein